MGMVCTPCRRRRGCTCHPGRGGIGLQVEMHSSERPMYKTGSSVGRSRRHDLPTHALSLTKKPDRLNELAPFSLTKPRQVLSQRKNCKQRTQAPGRAHANQHPRLQEHLARYRDCARVSRRNDRLHGKTSPPAAWKARCCYSLSTVERDFWEIGRAGSHRGREQGGAGERRDADGRGRVGEGTEQGGDRQWADGEAKAACNEGETVHDAERGSKRAEL